MPPTCALLPMGSLPGSGDEMRWLPSCTPDQSCGKKPPSISDSYAAGHGAGASVRNRKERKKKFKTFSALLCNLASFKPRNNFSQLSKFSALSVSCWETGLFSAVTNEGTDVWCLSPNHPAPLVGAALAALPGRLLRAHMVWVDVQGSGSPWECHMPFLSLSRNATGT